MGGGLAEHAAEGVLGFFEALVGFGVALLGVLEVVAKFLEDVGESFHLLFHAVETTKDAAGVFLDLHAAHAHGDDAEIGVERVGGNSDDFFLAAVGIDCLALAVQRVEHFAINIFGRYEHQGDVERAFVGDDVFLGDGIGVTLDGGGEGAAGLIAVGFDAAESVEGKLRVDGHEFFVAQEDDGIGGFSGGEAVLQRKLRGRKRIFEEALQGDFSEEAAGLGAAENVFDGLRGEGKAAALFVNGADLFLKLEDLLAGVLQFRGDGGLALRGDVRGAGDAVVEGFGDAFEALGDGSADGLDLAGALRLRLRDGEEVAAELGELGFEGGAFLLGLRDLYGEPED